MPICLPNCQCLFSWGLDGSHINVTVSPHMQGKCMWYTANHVPCSEADGLRWTRHFQQWSLTVSCGFAKSIDSLATDISLINSCGRMTSCKKYSSLLSFPSFWEAKSAHSLGKMLSRNELHLSHNSIKDHGIYKADFGTLLVNRLCWGIYSAYAALRRFCNTYYGGG